MRQFADEVLELQARVPLIPDCMTRHTSRAWSTKRVLSATAPSPRGAEAGGAQAQAQAPKREPWPRWPSGIERDACETEQAQDHRCHHVPHNAREGHPVTALARRAAAPSITIEGDGDP